MALVKRTTSSGLSTNAVHCWILDYYCQSTLKEWAKKFEPYSNKYVRTANFLGNFSDELVISKDLQFKLELISWLPQLHNLPKQQKLEAYTEILKEIDATNDICPESLIKETKDFFNRLKKLCLLLCCQNVGFSAATEIYEGLDDANKLDEESDEELCEILKSEDPQHEGLQCHIPSSISSIVSGYLHNHVIPSTMPFLLTAAKEALKEEEDEEESFNSSPAKKKKNIEPDILVQLAKEFNEGSNRSDLYLDNSEKTIYLNKLKSNWKEKHLKYHERLKKFENEIFSHQKDKESTSTPMVASDNRLSRTSDLTLTPVKRRFPELETIKLRNSLRPIVTKPIRTGYRVPWTTEQEEEFYKAVKKLGLGNWAEIRDYISFHKTNINLKDKWRSFHKSGRINSLVEKFGKI